MSKYTKEKIEPDVRTKVWEYYCGHTTRGKCLSCNSNEIRLDEFQTGHVIAESNGGKLTITNLRPICQKCNGRMHTKNMREFIEARGYILSPHFNGYIDKHVDINQIKQDYAKSYSQLIELHPGYVAGLVKHYNEYIESDLRVKKIDINNDITNCQSCAEFIEDSIIMTGDVNQFITLDKLYDNYIQWSKIVYPTKIPMSKNNTMEIFISEFGEMVNTGFRGIIWLPIYKTMLNDQYDILNDTSASYNAIRASYDLMNGCTIQHKYCHEFAEKYITKTKNKTDTLTVHDIYNKYRGWFVITHKNQPLISDDEIKIFMKDILGDMLLSSFYGIKWTEHKKTTTKKLLYKIYAPYNSRTPNILYDRTDLFNKLSITELANIVKFNKYRYKTDDKNEMIKYIINKIAHHKYDEYLEISLRLLDDNTIYNICADIGEPIMNDKNILLATSKICRNICGGNIIVQITDYIKA
ncbi:MAG: HNH endonuclease [Faunusvirus sp.]|jgi:hypothetical protein|uniref:HNH endonuclease n=1 Tax=Faunusvirus sp. TaxID=2487766 RepID=A0A3G4ZW34_9VIRU|nr:MAG: HNH endonuclease [Faunusvirus sp.]